MSLKRLGFLNETGQKVKPDHITQINYGLKKGAIVIEIILVFFSQFRNFKGTLFGLKTLQVNINNDSCILCY